MRLGKSEPKSPNLENPVVSQFESNALTGSDKPTTVSVILSRSEEFVSDRSRGWSLAPQEEKTPQDAATSEGSS